MYELIINNERILLSEKQKITITKQVNNLGELKDRQATYTNKFKVRKTSRVLKMFDGLGITGNRSRLPYVINGCKLIVNGIELLSNGNCYITSGNKDFFDLTIYDGNIYFFQQMGNKKLSELDFTDLNHQLTPTNYVDSFDNSEGYIYAISDNGKINTDFTTDKIEINYQLASVYVSAIFKKIFEGTDFDYEFIDFDDRKFKKLALTPKRGYNAEIDTVNNPFQINITDFLQSITINASPYPIYTGYAWDNPNPIFPINSLGSIGFSPNTAHLNSGLITINETGNYRISLSVDCSVSGRQSNGFRIGYFVNGQWFNPSYLIDGTETSTNNYTASFDIVVPFNAGDIVQTGYSVNLLVIASYFTGTILLSSDLIFEPNIASVIDLDFSSFIGDLTQKAFFKAIMQHFGFIMQPKPNSKTYQFKRMQDILTDTGSVSTVSNFIARVLADGGTVESTECIEDVITSNFYDWSDDFVEEIKEDYQLKGYGQLNRMGYQYFGANSDKFADGFLTVDNLNLKTEKTLFTSPFNACDTSETTLNSSIITSTPFWTPERDDSGLITEYKPIDNKNYLAEIKKVNETIKYGLTDGTSVNYNGLVPRLDFRNLRYNTIINENYDRLGVVLDWNNVKQIKVRLTAKDVVDFDFFKLVYIDKLASYFYVNNIKYKGQSTSIVEVVKVEKQAFVCDLVANAGSYADVPKGELYLRIDGALSQGNIIDTWLWEVVSEPYGSSATFDDSSISITDFNMSVSGTYVIKLTISNANCSSVSQTTIIKLE